ncbi:MAG: TIGR03936 family radical SAM-associated protein [Phycisphaerae bacterium]
MERERWVFAFSVDGDLRFISHRDTLRLFKRALARASLPVRYTEGFNPHPRLSIPLPRPVGVSSQAEAIVVEFERPINGDEVLGKLDHQAPAGIEMTSARRLAPREQLQPALVRYRLDLGDTPGAEVEPRVRQILGAGVLPIKRVNLKDGQMRSIDVRPFLEDMHADGDTVEFTLRVTGTGTVKPAEIAELLGYDVDSINHRIRRVEVQWR